MDGCSLDCPKELYVCCKNCDNLVAGKEEAIVDLQMVQETTIDIYSIRAKKQI